MTQQAIHADTLTRSLPVPPTPSAPIPDHYQTDVEWKMNPELELWIDVERTPVNIRLKGTLDGRTCVSVRSVVKQLLNEGYRSLHVEMDELELPDDAGFSSLVAIESLVKEMGGALEWSVGPRSND